MKCQSGECVEEGNLYKGIFAFMVVGLKESVPFVVHTIPEATVNGLWLAEKISKKTLTIWQKSYFLYKV